MGIGKNIIELLLREFKSYNLHGCALTFGVQGIEGQFNDIVKLFIDAEWPMPIIRKDDIIYDNITQFGNSLHQSTFFRLLGYQEVKALDAFPAEKPDYLLNLNDPVPENIKSKFDLVYDGGCIEHIFDVKTVLSNVVALLNLGGYIMHHIPINGYLNHGYYQFSPEMLYDFYSINGFGNIKMYYHYEDHGNCYYFPIDRSDQIPKPMLGNKALIFFAAQKINALSKINIPNQNSSISLGKKTRQYKLEKLIGKKVLIWGKSKFYTNNYYDWITDNINKIDLLGFVDNDPKKWNTSESFNVYGPEKISELNPDIILIASCSRSEIIGQLYKMELKHTVCIV